MKDGSFSRTIERPTFKLSIVRSGMNSTCCSMTVHKSPNCLSFNATRPSDSLPRILGKLRNCLRSSSATSWLLPNLSSNSFIIVFKASSGFLPIEHEKVRTTLWGGPSVWASRMSMTSIGWRFSGFIRFSSEVHHLWNPCGSPLYTFLGVSFSAVIKRCLLTGSKSWVSELCASLGDSLLVLYTSCGLNSGASGLSECLIWRSWSSRSFRVSSTHRFTLPRFCVTFSFGMLTRLDIEDRELQFDRIEFSIAATLLLMSDKYFQLLI